MICNKWKNERNWWTNEYANLEIWMEIFDVAQVDEELL